VLRVKFSFRNPPNANAAVSRYTVPRCVRAPLFHVRSAAGLVSVSFYRFKFTSANVGRPSGRWTPPNVIPFVLSDSLAARVKVHVMHASFLFFVRTSTSFISFGSFVEDTCRGGVKRPDMT
jgi:hypothetical protein